MQLCSTCVAHFDLPAVKVSRNTKQSKELGMAKVNENHREMVLNKQKWQKGNTSNEKKIKFEVFAVLKYSFNNCLQHNRSALLTHQPLPHKQ